MFDIIEINKKTKYLDIIEIIDSHFIVKKGREFTNWHDECSYFIEKFSPTGYGEYEMIDDSTADIFLYT